MHYLRNFFIDKIKSEIPNNILNGSLEDRLPNNVNFTFYGINGEDLLLKLNEYGILASTGSACSTNRQKESHVLKAIGLNYEEISGSIRFSLGIQNTIKEIEKTVMILKKSISELSKLSPLKQKYNL
jgi:cysteine desulfurase